MLRQAERRPGCDGGTAYDGEAWSRRQLSVRTCVTLVGHPGKPRPKERVRAMAPASSARRERSTRKVPWYTSTTRCRDQPRPCEGRRRRTTSAMSKLPRNAHVIQDWQLPTIPQHLIAPVPIVRVTRSRFSSTLTVASASTSGQRACLRCQKPPQHTLPRQEQGVPYCKIRARVRNSTRKECRRSITCGMARCLAQLTGGATFQYIHASHVPSMCPIR